MFEINLAEKRIISRAFGDFNLWQTEQSCQCRSRLIARQQQEQGVLAAGEPSAETL